MAEIANPRYCPTDWLDEVNPLGDTPEAFAHRLDDSWLLLDPEEDEDAETYFKSHLEAGQIVNFAKLTTLPDFTLTVRADGSHHADVPQLPKGHTSFRLPDWDWEDSVDEISELIRLGEGPDLTSDRDDPLSPGIYIVECWTWQDTIPFRFEPDGDTPKFILCAGAS